MTTSATHELILIEFLLDYEGVPALEPPNDVNIDSITPVATRQVAMRWVWVPPTFIGPGATSITYALEMRVWSGGTPSRWQAESRYNGTDLFFVSNVAESDDEYQIRVNCTNNADTPVTSAWTESPRIAARERSGGRFFSDEFDPRFE